MSNLQVESLAIPPFHLMTAEWDLVGFEDQADNFVRELRKLGIKVNHFSISSRNHFSILTSFGRRKTIKKYKTTIEGLCFQFLSNVSYSHEK